MNKLNLNSKVKLNNGIEIPLFGLGTYLIDNGQAAVDSMLYALEIGYRHLDTAAMYNNEREVGQVVKGSGIPRQDIFITTKLWNSDHGYQNTLEAFKRSLDKLQLDYVDLYLIHWPVEEIRLESWRALESLYADGLCKAIGVSNYMERHIKEILENFDVVPAVNQIEYSPFLYLKDLQEFCETNKVALESYSPLTKGYRLKDTNLIEIAHKYSKSTSQILIRWCLQKGVICIPKSSRKDHIKENSDIYDFEISELDMEKLDNLNENYHSTWDPTNVV